MNTGLLILRLVAAALVAAHGTQKLTHLLGGSGLAASTQEFADDGFRGGRLTAVAAGGTQLGAAVLIALGLATPAGAAGLIGVMVVAAGVKVPHGPWALRDGYEYPLLLAMLGLVLAWTGPGRWSLDEMLGLTRLWGTGTAVAATILGIGSALTIRVLLHHPARIQGAAGALR
jgi:putative oxidoreductase